MCYFLETVILYGCNSWKTKKYTRRWCLLWEEMSPKRNRNRYQWVLKIKVKKMTFFLLVSTFSFITFFFFFSFFLPFKNKVKERIVRTVMLFRLYKNVLLQTGWGLFRWHKKIICAVVEVEEVFLQKTGYFSDENVDANFFILINLWA